MNHKLNMNTISLEIPEILLKYLVSTSLCGIAERTRCVSIHHIIHAVNEHSQDPHFKSQG